MTAAEMKRAAAAEDRVVAQIDDRLDTAKAQGAVEIRVVDTGGRPEDDPAGKITRIQGQRLGDWLVSGRPWIAPTPLFAADVGQS
jgi:hypothetical protein